MHSWLRTLLYFLGAVIITACISVAVTITVLNAQHGERVILDSEEYQKYEALLPILELMENIRAEHYGDPVEDKEMIDGALQGILDSVGDPHAKYYTEEEYLSYLEEMGGAYHGVGAVVGQPQEDDSGGHGVPVLKVYTKSPAEEAGLLAGDLITVVDGQPLSGLLYDDIAQLLSGADGSSVSLTVLRGGQEQHFVIERAGGTLARVDHKLFLQRTGYIRIDQFSGTASEEFTEAIRDLTDRGMRSLVLDLRNNPGGELEQVVSIANMLLLNAPIVTIRYANGKEDAFVADKRATEVPLAVLVNEYSASASEILAAAIQENTRGIVVGTQTYGKGVVQTTMQLRSNRSWVKLTTAAYYTPLNNNVEGTGVLPDIDIDLAAELKTLPIDSIEQEDDAQLWAALDYVREQADALEEERTLSEDDDAQHAA